MDYGVENYGEDTLIDRIRDLEGEISELEGKLESAEAEGLLAEVKKQVQYYDDNYGECCSDCDLEMMHDIMYYLRKAVTKVETA